MGSANVAMCMVRARDFDLNFEQSRGWMIHGATGDSDKIRVRVQVGWYRGSGC